jgi:hypothetical protein
MPGCEKIKIKCGTSKHINFKVVTFLNAEVDGIYRYAIFKGS